MIDERAMQSRDTVKGKDYREIPSVIDALMMEIEGLENVINSLTVSIKPVLADADGTPTERGSEDSRAERTMNSDLGKVINIASFKVNAMRKSVVRLVKNIQL